MSYFDVPLTISDDKRFFMKGTEPFFWLGDTAWLMLRNLKETEIRQYLRNRKDKGYNVIQTNLIWDKIGRAHV